MEGYQFGHLETWSVVGFTGSPHHAERRANGERAWTAAEILDEAERAPGASFHVEPGGEPPQVLPGAVASFYALRTAHEAVAEIRESFDYTDPKTGAKGVRNRKLRRDARTLFTAGFSLPVETAAARADPALRARCVGVLENAIAHEAKRIGALGGTAMMGVCRDNNGEFSQRRIKRLFARLGLGRISTIRWPRQTCWSGGISAAMPK